MIESHANLRELTKKKYKKNEVLNVIEKISADYENVISELKVKNEELLSQISDLEKQLSDYKGKESAVSAAIIDSEVKAGETQKKIDDMYFLAVEKIKGFSQKFDEYVSFLKGKYPFYPFINKTSELHDKISSIVSGDNEKTVDEIDKELDGVVELKQEFNPKDKIKEYIATTSDDGFNINDVLNPGELKLEDLCKELGLLEEE